MSWQLLPSQVPPLLLFFWGCRPVVWGADSLPSCPGLQGQPGALPWSRDWSFSFSPSFGPGLAPGFRLAQQSDRLCPPRPWRCFLHKGRPRAFFRLGLRCISHPSGGILGWPTAINETGSPQGLAMALAENLREGVQRREMKNNRFGAGKNHPYIKRRALFSENFRTGCTSKVGSV